MSAGPPHAASSFFEQQEAARHASRLLIVLFALAVALIVLAVNAALAAAFIAAAGHGAWAHHGLSVLPEYFFETTTAVVLLMILGGTALQILELREGGEAVARLVGARPVAPATREPRERRLLNVMEEMAIAAGIPAPRAFVLDGEHGINAFAAGLRTSDAVVTVTQGALERLTRDELQGVIGHEFSHILNGDVALNLRLLGMLNGLLLLSLFGRFLLSLGDVRDRRDGAVAVSAFTGLVMLAFGSIGVFAGRLIKAAVSRQREFLADASSVQFTRNPDGIGGALRKIGGLDAAEGGAIRHHQAESLSHMFMAAVSPSLASGLLASHPPLFERLRRIYGHDVAPVVPGIEPVDGADPPAPIETIAYTSALAPAAVPSPLGAAPSRAAAAGPTAGSAGGWHSSVGRPVQGTSTFAAGVGEWIEALGLRPALSDPDLARLLALAMLLDRDEAVCTRQCAAVAASLGAAGAERMRAFAQTMATLPPGWRLPLLDLSMPALRLLDGTGRAALLDLANVLIHADGRVTLAEFLFFSLLRRRLQAPVRAAARARLADLGGDCALIASLIASLRRPADPQGVFEAVLRELPGRGAFVPRADMTPGRLTLAFDRLAQLTPLQKPLLVKACIAGAFCDGPPPWTCLSALRTLCAALDSPLPPQVEAAER